MTTWIGNFKNIIMEVIIYVLFVVFQKQDSTSVALFEFLVN